MKDEFFEWTDDYSVGIKEIDAQHKRLFDIINNFYEAFIQGKADLVVSETLDELLLYTRYHFKSEETLMKEYDLPDITAHQRKHREFEDEIMKRIDDLKRKDGKVHYKTMNYLKDWLLGHILGMDKNYFKNLDID